MSSPIGSSNFIYIDTNKRYLTLNGDLVTSINGIPIEDLVPGELTLNYLNSDIIKQTFHFNFVKTNEIINK